MDDFELNDQPGSEIPVHDYKRQFAVKICNEKGCFRLPEKNGYCAKHPKKDDNDLELGDLAEA